MFFLHAYAEPVGGIGEIRHKQGAGCADGDCRRLTGDIYAELPQQPQTAAVGLDVAFLECPQRVERVFALGRRERGQVLHLIGVEEAVGNIGFEGAECDRLKWTFGAAVRYGLPFSFAAISSGRGTDGKQRRTASSSSREAVKLC